MNGYKIKGLGVHQVTILPHSVGYVDKDHKKGHVYNMAEVTLIILIGLFWGVISTVLSSFICVVAERTDRGEGLSGRSHCVCGRQLFWHENIPIIGWVKTKGTAKCCQNKIPTRYVIAETVTFIAGFVTGAMFYNNIFLTIAIMLLVQLGLYLTLKYGKSRVTS